MENKELKELLTTIVELLATTAEATASLLQDRTYAVGSARDKAKAILEGVNRVRGAAQKVQQGQTL